MGVSGVGAVGGPSGREMLSESALVLALVYALALVSVSAFVHLTQQNLAFVLDRLCVP